MKKSLLAGLFSLSLMSVTAAASQRQMMVDGIPDDQVMQSVDMTGPAGFQTKAALVTTEGDGALAFTIIETQGAANYMAVYNTELGIEIENPGGTNPQLNVNKYGSVLLSQDNENFPSRDMWKRTLTVSYKDGRYVLSGFTLNYRDTRTGQTDVCDYNLLNGKGVRNGRKVQVLTQATDIQSLKDSEKLYTCKGW